MSDQDSTKRSDIGTKPVMNMGDNPGIGEFMAAANSGRRQSMQGFDPDYVDIVDYIIRCTHKIWEEGGIGLIYSHYAHNVFIETSDGVTYGRDAVIAASIRVMNAFPNIRLLGDDVIWSGNDQEGFQSSHRIYWTGNNTGYSVYGPPTGRSITRYGIAHCLVKENRIVEEWIARDEMALILQLGFNPHDLARRMVEIETERQDNSSLGPVSQGEVSRLRGQEPPPAVPEPTVEGFDVDYFVRRAFHEIWNWRLLNKIAAYYTPRHWAYVPPNRYLYGPGEYKAHLLSLLAAFSDLALQVDHVCWIRDKDGRYRVAVRWTMQGTHDGPGWYGPPTGKRIRVLGITHLHIENQLITREWMIFDQFALLKQLYRSD
ncbi:MAG: ester cyclase [Candidatus Promineifilaceae bacterium]|nr:ester cyclase [Candidatus Promineifilaceae bacterium]